MSHQTVTDILARRGVPHTMHEPVGTVVEAEARLPFPVERFLKTLAFRVRGAGWALAALRGHDRIDYRRLADALGVPRAEVQAATPDDVAAQLGHEPGAVSPIPTRDGVMVLFDEGVTTMDAVYCGSGRRDRTLEIRMADLLAVVQPRLAPLRRSDPG